MIDDDTLLLIVRKKTLVPTKNQIAHRFRSDWKPVGKIDYNLSRKLFRFFNYNPQGMQFDSEFAWYLFDNFGNGEYSVLAWKKGRKDFWSFIHLDCRQNGYVRINKSTEPEDNNEEYYERLKQLFEQEKDSNKKAQYEEELEYTYNNSIKRKNKHGCSPYLRTCMPYNVLHLYNEVPSKYYVREESNYEEESVVEVEEDNSYEEDNNLEEESITDAEEDNGYEEESTIEEDNDYY